MLTAQIDPKRLVFVDEMGTNTSLSVLRAWSPRGQRAYCSVPRNRGSNTTLISSMTTMEGMGPSLAVEGATTRAVFEAYVEWGLSPTLCPGQVVVMDNLTAHKGERVRELIEERGAVNCSIYHPTLQTLTLSRKLSARSRPSYEKLKLAAARH